jgi:putative NIF3 family GTP cyclohydrolase 1 type 2
MNALDIHKHFAPFRAWQPEDKTCDGVKIGDPAAAVRAIAVMWKPRLSAVQEAFARGCNFILAHESVFRQGNIGDESAAALPAEQPKLAYLRQHQIICYRCHDAWDATPDIGVRDCYARGLGYPLTPTLPHDQYMRTVDAGGVTFADLCAHVLSRVTPLGQQTLIASGDPQRRIHRLTLGTGAANNLDHILETRADACIVSDDYFRFVRDGVFLDEAGVPFIVLNHGTLEEWGIQSLAAYTKKVFAPIPVHFFPQGCTYRVVQAEG